jgi:uncharacterized delta-60 repeat protein
MRPSRIAVAGALALVSLLTSAGAASAQRQDSRPVREWRFSEVRQQLGAVLVERGRQQGGRLGESHVFGPAAIDFVEPGDGIATGEIFSSATGNLFEVLAESPSHGGELPDLGGHSRLEQTQSYLKRTDDASLRFTISEALVEAIDENGPVLLPSECPAGQDCPVVHGIVRFELRAYAQGSAADFFGTKGVAFIHGHTGDWEIQAATLPGAQVPLWENEQFDRDVDADGDGNGEHAKAFLKEPLNVDVDLSSLETRELFATQVTFDTQAIDSRGGESGVKALVRNAEPDGPLVEITGLRPRGEPTFDAPPITVPAPAVCPSGPDPDAGTLQFSRPDYVTDETAGSPFVLVTRTGGTVGAVSASVITSDGSAAAGADYTAVSTTVRFEDGDSSPRLVEIPILQDDLVESDETFDVSLLDPNCVLFGAETTAEVTIAGVPNQPDPDEFTIGGTVTGLEGAGLVLATSGADDLTIAANGPFEFTPPAPDGRVYDVSVVTEPDDPDQACTVADGIGTVTGADVTDILVECSTPAPVSGLDPTFDGDGRMSAQVSGGHTEAVVVQPDGMIVSAGGGSDFNLTRVDADGVLDETFDGDGIVTTNLGGSDIAMDVALQPDGKIVAVGKSGSDWAIVRYLANGTPDSGFGTNGNGIVKTDFDAGTDTANGVVVDPDGRIVVAGSAAISPPGGFFEHDFAVARYDEDGILDLAFGGGDGLVTTDFGGGTDLGNDVALDANGRIIVGGQVEQSTASGLVRYETNGDHDTSFDGGPVFSSSGGRAIIKGVAVRPDDGRIVVAGSVSSGVSEHDFALAVYRTDGDVDSSFGALGLVTTDVSPGQAFADDFAEDLAIQADGKIVVAGRNTSDTFNDLALVRYAADGEVDESFGGEGDGVILTDFLGSGDRGNDVAIDSDGRIVAAVDASNGGSFSLARALP